MKTCSVCGQTLPIEAFAKGRRQCKECFRRLNLERNNAAYRKDPERHAKKRLENYHKRIDEERALKRKRYAKDPEKHRQIRREKYHRDIERSRAMNRDWQKRNYTSVRNSRLKENYGITLDDYNTMLEAQGGVCKICGGTDKNGQALAVDHDHQTGKIRGLLCGNCNRGIGFFQDSPELLCQAAEYLTANEQLRPKLRVV